MECGGEIVCLMENPNTIREQQEVCKNHHSYIYRHLNLRRFLGYS